MRGIGGRCALKGWIRFVDFEEERSRPSYLRIIRISGDIRGYDVVALKDRRQIMADDNRRVWIDCRKTRKVEEEWRLSGKSIKELGPTNLLESVTDKKSPAPTKFKRVKETTLKTFSDGCRRPQADFYADPNELAQWQEEQANQLGLSNDGRVSSSDARMLEQLYKRLCGFYELYHYATSTREAPKVSLSLLHVNGLDATRSAIQCEIHDNTQTRPYFRLVGHITMIAGFLEWSLGPAHEVVVCRGFSYLPVGEKYRDFTLYGIFLSLSGDGKLDYPVAARGALRFLGETANEAIRNSVVDLRAPEAEPEKLLKSSVGGYVGDLQERKLLRSDILKQIEAIILPRIDNVISADAAPRALIVPR